MRLPHGVEIISLRFATCRLKGTYFLWPRLSEGQALFDQLRPFSGDVYSYPDESKPNLTLVRSMSVRVLSAVFLCNRILNILTSSVDDQRRLEQGA